jgi:hypothetical protein
MRLEDAYRMALARGLTAKQAGAEFGVNYSSLGKVKNRYNFPSLVSEYEAQSMASIAKMKNEEIKSYMNVLKTNGRGIHRDIKLCQKELAKRK